MEIIGKNLERYDLQHHPKIGSNLSDIALVKYLMHKEGLYQKDLAHIFGGQANVSRFLSGERALNKAHISGLKQLFFISADAFIRE